MKDDKKTTLGSKFQPLEDEKLGEVTGGVFNKVDRKKDPAQSIQPGMVSSKVPLKLK